MTLAEKLKDPEWLTQTAVQLLSANLPGVAVQLAQTLTPESGIAAELVAVFCRAMERASGEELRFELKPQEWRELDLARLDPQFPSHHPLFRLALDGLLRAASAKYLEPVSLERRVRQDFALTFAECIRASDKSKLKDYLNAFRHYYNLDEGKLLAHTNQVLISVSDPLPIDPSTTLKQMYVEPLAKYRYFNEEKEGKAEEVTLLRQLAKVLQSTREPVVVHGQPGHGKSSAMKMLIQARLAALESGEDPPTLLFLEFKNLGQLNRNELIILRERCSFIGNESYFYGRRTLLILDGMDERQVTDSADGDLKEFVRHMLRLAGEINRRGDSRLNLVFTGRSQFFQGVRSAFQKYHAFELLDFDEKRIGQWLAKFNKLKKPSEDLSNQKLRDYQFGELMSQPILLTMIGLLICDPKYEKLIRSMGKLNRASVYETLISWTYMKRWHSDKKAEIMEEQEYFALLQAVAFCMFRRGTDIIRLSDLMGDLSIHQNLLDVSMPTKELLEAECRSLAISFFFEGLENKAFSFIHKSFGDFLLVRALYETLKRLGAKFRPGLSDKAKPMVEEMYALLGARPLSLADHWSFMLEMAANDWKASGKLVLPLREFVKSAQSHRYLLKNGGGLGDNPLATEASLLSGALSWLVICNLAQEQPVLLEVFEGVNDFGHYLALLEAVPMEMIRAYQWLSLKGARLVRARLAHSYFARADLQEAVLEDAEFKGADLLGANLQDAFLIGTNLKKADLKHAVLRFAHLQDADFMAANLSGADLRGADLGNAHLQHANLNDAELYNANLLRADLYQANLDNIRGWQSIEYLETAIIADVINPPPGFLEHVQSLRDAASASANDWPTPHDPTSSLPPDHDRDPIT